MPPELSSSCLLEQLSTNVKTIQQNLFASRFPRAARSKANIPTMKPVLNSLHTLTVEAAAGVPA